MIIALCSSDFSCKSDRIITKYLLCRMSRQNFKELFKVVRLQSIWKEKFFPVFEVVHYRLDVWCTFKYRPYSHVHAWLHSTAHPQRKLPIIFCVTPHTSPTYSPFTFSRTLFHLMETNLVASNSLNHSHGQNNWERNVPVDYIKTFVLTDSKKFFYFQHVFMFHHMAFLHLFLKLENDIH